MNASFVFLSSGLGEFETALLIESCHRFEKKKKQLAGLTRSLKVMEYENLKICIPGLETSLKLEKKLSESWNFRFSPKLFLADG